MNFKDESIKNMYQALNRFCKCGIMENGKIIKCAANDNDFIIGWAAIDLAHKEMPWLKETT